MLPEFKYKIQQIVTIFSSRIRIASSGCGIDKSARASVSTEYDWQFRGWNYRNNKLCVETILHRRSTAAITEYIFDRWMCKF